MSKNYSYKEFGYGIMLGYKECFSYIDMGSTRKNEGIGDYL